MAAVVAFIGSATIAVAFISLMDCIMFPETYRALGHRVFFSASLSICFHNLSFSLGMVGDGRVFHASIACELEWNTSSSLNAFP